MRLNACVLFYMLYCVQLYGIVQIDSQQIAHCGQTKTRLYDFIHERDVDWRGAQPSVDKITIKTNPDF